MNIPAVSMASADRMRSGVLDALATADSGAQGSGSGGGGAAAVKAPVAGRVRAPAWVLAPAAASAVGCTVRAPAS